MSIRIFSISFTPSLIELGTASPATADWIYRYWEIFHMSFSSKQQSHRRKKYPSHSDIRIIHEFSGHYKEYQQENCRILHKGCNNYRIFAVNAVQECDKARRQLSGTGKFPVRA